MNGKTFYNKIYADEVAAFVAQKEQINIDILEPSLIPGMDLKVN